MYARNPHTLDDLKKEIRREINSITEEKLMGVHRAFLSGCQKCVHVGGEYFQHVRAIFVILIVMHGKSQYIALQILCCIAGDWCAKGQAGIAPTCWALLDRDSLCHSLLNLLACTNFSKIK